jgi:acetoacetyl-CoA reductase/3-oxoacyl-[acyl-carrier protein] reductase
MIPSLGLENQVVLVTGGNRGIGAAIVNLLVELGSKVAYTYRSQDDGQLGTLAIPADVTSQAVMEEVAK